MFKLNINSYYIRTGIIFSQRNPRFQYLGMKYFRIERKLTGDRNIFLLLICITYSEWFTSMCDQKIDFEDKIIVLHDKWNLFFLFHQQSKLSGILLKLKHHTYLLNEKIKRAAKCWSWESVD